MPNYVLKLKPNKGCSCLGLNRLLRFSDSDSWNQIHRAGRLMHILINHYQVRWLSVTAGDRNTSHPRRRERVKMENITFLVSFLLCQEWNQHLNDKQRVSRGCHVSHDQLLLVNRARLLLQGQYKYKFNKSKYFWSISIFPTMGIGRAIRRVLASRIRVSACYAVVAQHGSYLAPCKAQLISPVSALSDLKELERATYDI